MYVYKNQELATYCIHVHHHPPLTSWITDYLQLGSVGIHWLPLFYLTTLHSCPIPGYWYIQYGALPVKLLFSKMGRSNLTSYISVTKTLKLQYYQLSDMYNMYDMYMYMYMYMAPYPVRREGQTNTGMPMLQYMYMYMGMYLSAMEHAFIENIIIVDTVNVYMYTRTCNKRNQSVNTQCPLPTSTHVHVLVRVCVHVHTCTCTYTSTCTV